MIFELKRKILAQLVAVVLCGTFVTTTQAEFIPSYQMTISGAGLWDYSGPGTLIDLSFGGGDFTNSFDIPYDGRHDHFIVTITADDWGIPGDAFGLILDGVFTPWTFAHMPNNGVNGAGLFHGSYTGLLHPGLHSFSLEVTADCCGEGGMAWSVAVVPEPETYAMLLAGLGLLGFMTRRRKENA